MSIDHCLILSAGFGTRMGEIGKHIPKVLWPIFNKKMLKLQIDFVKALGCKDIYINSHFLHEELEAFIASLNDSSITLLYEKELLGSGGAIHNLVSKLGDQAGKTLLTTNADQFYFFDEELFKKGLSIIKNNHAVFFGLKVNEHDHYNKFLLEGDHLKNIIPNDKKSGDYFTYSGMGLINLTRLKSVQGESHFFETVANYKNDSIAVLLPENGEYWDFGTLGLYHKNIFRLKNEFEDNSIKSLMKSFCKDNDCQEPDGFCDAQSKNIYFSNKKTTDELIKNSIIYKNIIEEIKE